MEWKQLIYGDDTFEHYEVSCHGEIRSLDKVVDGSHGTTYIKKGRILKSRTNKIEPYLFVEISSNKRRKTIYNHKAVFDTFSKKRSDYVSHKNGDTYDNHFKNLFAITHSELQIRNIHVYPEARWRLANHNKASGYYTKGTAQKLDPLIIKRIKELHSKGELAKWIAVKMEISLSSVYKHRNTKVRV